MTATNHVALLRRHLRQGLQRIVGALFGVPPEPRSAGDKNCDAMRCSYDVLPQGDILPWHALPESDLRGKSSNPTLILAGLLPVCNCPVAMQNVDQLFEFCSESQKCKIQQLAHAAMPALIKTMRKIAIPST